MGFHSHLDGLVDEAMSTRSPEEIKSIVGFLGEILDRLNAAGFDFNALQRRRIAPYPGLAASDLAPWSGKTTAALVSNIYDKLKDLRSRHEFTPEQKFNRRRLINIHKRLLLLLRHARDES